MKAKKFLGQHFLTSHSAVSRLVGEACVRQSDTILEIGPGKGALTEALLANGAHVVAVEKDAELTDLLEQRFGAEIKSGQLVLVQGDVLDTDLADYELRTTNYKLVSNIPYNITGKILRSIIGGSIQPSFAALIVQKEVAERIVARNKKHSILSLSVHVYGTPRYIQTIKRGSFAPSPQVDSASIVIENISRDFFVDVDEEAFFKTVRAGFSHKRKQLRNNLPVSEEVLHTCGAVGHMRAEDLTPEVWKCITKNLYT